MQRERAIASRTDIRAGTLILATDLDGTFAAGTTRQRRNLQVALAEISATLLYVTGRTIEATRRLMAEAHLPGPHLLIADVGTSVVRGEDFCPLPVEDELQRAWPGHAAVRERLTSLPELVEQDINAPRRVSYTLVPDAATTIEQALEHTRLRLDGLGVDVLASAGTYIDVLPAGVNKGTTLRRVLRWLGRDDADVVVAGDSLNDLALFETGLHGILVGDSEPALAERIAHLDTVHRASSPGSAGIMEGLRHFGWLEASHGE